MDNFIRIIGKLIFFPSTNNDGK